jgi:hypothetical protein
VYVNLVVSAVVSEYFPAIFVPDMILGRYFLRVQLGIICSPNPLTAEIRVDPSTVHGVCGEQSATGTSTSVSVTMIPSLLHVHLFVYC